MVKNYIVGAGKQGRIMLPYILINSEKDYVINGYFDDNKTGKDIIGKLSDIEKIVTKYDNLFLGFGDNQLRKNVYEQFKDSCSFPNAIHKSAIYPWEMEVMRNLIHSGRTIPKGIDLGKGITIAPGVIINPLSRIGNACIINTGVILEHETIIGDYCNICPGVSTMGGVEIGTNVTIGPGAIICKDVKIGSNSLIGAGSVVLEDISENVFACGIPAKIKRGNIWKF